MLRDEGVAQVIEACILKHDLKIACDSTHLPIIQPQFFIADLFQSVAPSPTCVFKYPVVSRKGRQKFSTTLIHNATLSTNDIQ